MANHDLLMIKIPHLHLMNPEQPLFSPETEQQNPFQPLHALKLIKDDHCKLECKTIVLESIHLQQSYISDLNSFITLSLADIIIHR